MTPKVGFVFSTKDRVDFTKKSLASIDLCGGFDLIWTDGSDTEEGKALPGHISLRNCRLLEVHRDVRGGPDKAIRFGLQRLMELGYDYCGLIENDIELAPGWFETLMELFRLGEKDGLRVGATTVRTFSTRVLQAHRRYATYWNVGAGMALFTREAAWVVLHNYRMRSSQELSAYYGWKEGDHLDAVWELWYDRPDRALGCDWGFSLELHKRGLASLAAIPNLVRHMDLEPETFHRSKYVSSSNDVTETGWGEWAKARLLRRAKREYHKVKPWLDPLIGRKALPLGTPVLESIDRMQRKLFGPPMEYPHTCEACAKSARVTEAQAGTSRTCECGFQSLVPAKPFADAPAELAALIEQVRTFGLSYQRPWWPTEDLEREAKCIRQFLQEQNVFTELLNELKFSRTLLHQLSTEELLMFRRRHLEEVFRERWRGDKEALLKLLAATVAGVIEREEEPPSTPGPLHARSSPTSYIPQPRLSPPAS